MMNGVVYLICNLIRIYLIRQFIVLFFDDHSVSKRMELLVYGAFFAVNSGLYLGFHTAWINLVSSLAGNTIVILLYTRRWKNFLFVSAMTAGLCAGCDVAATGLLLPAYRDGQRIDSLSFIVVDMIMMVCVVLMNRIFEIRKQQGNLPSIVLVFVPICSVSIICYMTYTHKYLSSEYIIISTGVLLINFIVIYLYHMMLDYMYQKNENRLLHQRLHSYANQLDVILDSENRVKQLRHDMKHHLTEIRLLAKQKQDTEVEQYIDTMTEYIHNPREFVSSNDTEIDSLLNYMLARAKKEGIDVSAEVQLPNSLTCSFDINVILGNLLENAIDAALHSQEPKMSVSIQWKQGILKIRIENSFDGVIQKRGKFITTKADKENHGYGIQSVKEMVRRYHGEIIFSVEESFCVVVVLYM